MKNLLILFSLTLLIPFTLLAQDEEPETMMWELVTLHADQANMEALTEAMGEHNRTFHSEGAYSASVYAISSGPNVGKLVYVMGPMSSYGDLDNRPSGSDHDDHWNDVVMPHLDGVETVEYWTADSEISNHVEGDYSMMMMRVGEINQEYSFLRNTALNMISETVKAMDGENPWYMYWNQFQQGNIGRHFMMQWPMDSFAEMDENPDFRSTFEEIHGKPAWDDWLQMMDRFIADTYDEIWVEIPEMGGSE